MDKKVIKDMISNYITAPSIAFCRIPEVYYLSQVDIKEKNVLDHCCGDGYISQYSFSGARITAGIDLNSNSIAVARRRGNYEQLKVCDASQRLPFDNSVFDIVYNNSGLEHIPDLYSTLEEIFRVTKTGGKFYFCVLSSNYFRYWPLSKKSMKQYCEYQPFYHIFTKSEWEEQLISVGFEIESVRYYFNEAESSYLAGLDYIYSAYSIKKRPSVNVMINNILFRMSPGKLANYWIREFSRFSFNTETLNENNSSGLFIAATKI